MLPSSARECDKLVETARRSVLKVPCQNYDLRYRVQKLTFYIQAEAVKLEGAYGFDTAAKQDIRCGFGIEGGISVVYGGREYDLRTGDAAAWAAIERIFGRPMKDFGK